MTDRFGNYTIVQRLGVGGMATVDRAYVTLRDGKRYEVALKRILPHLEDDDRYVDLFLREANLASQLQHPRIVKVFEQGWVGRTCFIALELLRGDPLMVLMYEGRKARVQMPVGVMLALMIELCEMLEYVHHGEDARGEARRIVHRDLTPANLIIEDTGHLKVIDFGVAKTVRLGRSSTDSGQPKGKLGYMPLEALQGKQVDSRADIFSIGVVMWEMLCGRRLFKGSSDWEVMDKVRTGHVPPPSSINPECPTELDSVVLQAVARDFFDRWPSAGALRLELEHVRRNYEHESTPDAVIAWKREIASHRRPEPVEIEEVEASRIEIHDQPPADDEISAVNMDGFADAPFMSSPEDTIQSHAFVEEAPMEEAPMFLDEDDTQP